MPNLKPGDRIDCKVKDNAIVSPYRGFDEIKTFEIVAVGDYGYYIYIPYFYFMKDTLIADERRCKNLRIDPRFLNEHILHIQESMVLKVVSTMDGMRCKNCDEFYQYAEANQEDGTLLCYSCRLTPYR